MSSQMIGDSSPAAFIDRRLNFASAYPASRSPPYCCWAASSGQLTTEYAATSRCRSLAHATWSARHGLGWKPGPLVRPMRTYAAEPAGIGAPVEILCGIPIPAGTAATTRPRRRRRARARAAAAPRRWPPPGPRRPVTEPPRPRPGRARRSPSRWRVRSRWWPHRSARSAKGQPRMTSRRTSTRQPRGRSQPAPPRLGSLLLPDRHVGLAGRGVRRPVPPLPALAQPQPRQARHQVQLRRPGVAERHRVAVVAAVLRARVVVRPHQLGDRVVLVDAVVLVGVAEDPVAVVGLGPQHPRHPGLDDEEATRAQAPGGVRERRDLAVLGGDVPDGV